MTTRAERIAGGLVGLLVGDALGVPYEFHPPESIPPLAQIEFAPPVGFARAHRRAPYAAWSDDGAQALCLLTSLLECGHFDAEDFGRRIVRWYDEGYLAVDGKVFDVGLQTGRAIQRLQAGVPALEAETPSTYRAELIVFRSSAPSAAPTTVPLPPKIATPPTTTAAMTCSS